MLAKSLCTEYSEPSLQLEKSSGEEFCDESPDEGAAGDDDAASGRNPVDDKSLCFCQNALGLGMLSSGPIGVPVEEEKFVLSGVSGSQDLMDRLIARLSWTRRSLML